MNFMSILFLAQLYLIVTSLSASASPILSLESKNESAQNLLKSESLSGELGGKPGEARSGTNR